MCVADRAQVTRHKPPWTLGNPVHAAEAAYLVSKSPLSRLDNDDSTLRGSDLVNAWFHANQTHVHPDEWRPVPDHAWGSGWTFLGAGLYRVALLHNATGVVYKVPKDGAGQAQNEAEPERFDYVRANAPRGITAPHAMPYRTHMTVWDYGPRWELVTRDVLATVLAVELVTPINPENFDQSPEDDEYDEDTDEWLSPFDPPPWVTGALALLGYRDTHRFNVLQVGVDEWSLVDAG